MLKVKRVEVSSLKIDPSNARKHDAKNLEAIKGSLAKFGQVEPLVVRKATGVVIGGNGRLAAMQANGATQCDIVELDIDATQASALALALNRTSELAAWDDDVLSATLKALDADGFDIGAIGFDDFDFSVPPKEGLTDPDDIPEHVEPRTKPGDLYVLGGHRVLCGDSTDVLAVERMMGGEKADITFTSPPYNAGVSAKLSGNTSIDDNLYGDGHDDAMDPDDWLQFVSLATANSIKHSRYQFWNMQFLAGNRTALPRYWAAFKDHIVDVAIWDKGHAQPAAAERVLDSRFEFVFIFTSDDKPSRAIRCAPAFRGCIQNVFSIPPQMQNEFASIHAATFPVAFPETFIDKFAPVKGSVLELFAGTGTTLIACQKTGRRCFGMEIDPHYCDVIVERWERFTGEKAALEARI